MGYVGKVSSGLSPLLPRICSPLWVTEAPAVILAEPGDVRLLGYPAATGGARSLDHGLRLLISASIFSNAVDTFSASSVA